MKRRISILASAALAVLLLLNFSALAAQNIEGPRLAEIYQDYFLFGGAVSVASWAPKTLVSHRQIIEQHLSSVTAENAMKPDYLQPRKGQFNFREADQLVAFAQEHDLKVRGHTLIWHNQTPDWFFRDKDYKRIDLKDVITEEDRRLVVENLEAHIEAVMNHFGDSVYCWDVVNEAVSDDTKHILRQDSPWYKILGADFLPIAFRKAHEVNPNVKLFYNDYNAVAPYKRGRIVRLLQDLIDAGVPIHGMGIQAHWDVASPSISDIETAIEMYAELGLEIHITEMDVGMKGFTEEEQAERYGEIFRLFKKHSDVITNVTLWGLADDVSWRDELTPLLFNKEREPKPAFWALVDPERPWYVNKAEYDVAAVFKDQNGRELGSLKPGGYNLEELCLFGINLEEVAELVVSKGHLVTLYETEALQGELSHLISTADFQGSDLSRVKSLSVRALETENVVLNKPVQTNILVERAGRAIDGDGVSSWSPSGTPPYWLEVDLEGSYLLNRWVTKLEGTGPFGGGRAASPLNASDFKLQVSENGRDWIDADQIQGNTANITDRDLNFVSAGYVRLYVSKPTSMENNNNLVLYEFEVYGMPAE